MAQDVAAAPALARAPEAAAPPKAKRSLRRVLLPLLLIGAGAYGVYWAYDYFVEGRFLVSTDDAYVGAETVIVSPKVAGYVTDVLVKNNQDVRAGDLLARIDAGDYRLAVNAAKDKVATQDATVSRIERQIGAQRAMITQAQAQIGSARASADSAAADEQRASLEFDRAQKLKETSFGSQQRLEQANADKKRTAAAAAGALSALASAQAQFAWSEANLGVLQSQKVEAEHTRNELMTAVERAERDLSFTEIRAPSDGVVGNKAVEVGQYAQPGARLLALVPLDSAYVDANYKETQIGNIRPGQKVEVTVDAMNGKSIDCEVRSIAPASGAQFALIPPDNATGNFTKIVQRVTVRVGCDPEAVKAHVLRPGLSVVATVHTRDDSLPKPTLLGALGLEKVWARGVDIGQGPAVSAVALSAPVEEALDKRKLAAFIFMVFGMFMAILDIQIVSASLSQIQAGLSASQDEVTWVQTSYLVAEVIMIPLSGFLSRMLSTRVIFTISAAGFTLMSLGCSTATSIEEMIVWRALQGFIGGGMIPTVFASAYTIFPRSKMPLVAPIIGLVATLAPTIGPTVGGYLTDLFSWHWLFLVNIPPGIVVTVAAWMLIDFDKPDWSLLPRFDWWGLGAMAAFLGALEYALEEGPSKDWFESQPVTAAIVVSGVGAALFFWRAFTAHQPIVDLTAFRDRNFWTGCLLSAIMGVGLYGLTYIYPVYLAAVRGYTPLMIGETMFVTGVCMFLTAPISGKLMTKVDPRKMIAVGFAGFAFGTYLASKVTPDWDFYELLWPQVFRGVFMMLCMVPINNLSLGTMPPAKMKNASGIFNLTRNLGGAIGLAVINTILDKRMDLHLARLRESVIWGRSAAEETLASLTAAMAARGADAADAATKQLALMVRKQAEVMALADVFLVLTVIYLVALWLAAFMRRPQMAGGGGGGH